MTPSTPVIPLIYALKSKLEDIKAEGRRPLRPPRPAERPGPRLGRREGFQAVPQARATARSPSTALPIRSNVDLAALNKVLKAKHQLVIDGGYGKLKGKTFRISNMGDETDDTIAAFSPPSTRARRDAQSRRLS